MKQIISFFILLLAVHSAFTQNFEEELEHITTENFVIKHPVSTVLEGINIAQTLPMNSHRFTLGYNGFRMEDLAFNKYKATFEYIDMYKDSTTAAIAEAFYQDLGAHKSMIPGEDWTNNAQQAHLLFGAYTDNISTDIGYAWPFYLGYGNIVGFLGFFLEQSALGFLVDDHVLFVDFYYHNSNIENWPENYNSFIALGGSRETFIRSTSYGLLRINYASVGIGYNFFAIPAGLLSNKTQAIHLWGDDFGAVLNNAYFDLRLENIFSDVFQDTGFSYFVQKYDTQLLGFFESAFSSDENTSETTIGFKFLDLPLLSELLYFSSEFHWVREGEAPVQYRIPTALFLGNMSNNLEIAVKPSWTENSGFIYDHELSFNVGFKNINLYSDILISNSTNIIPNQMTGFSLEVGVELFFEGLPFEI